MPMLLAPTFPLRPSYGSVAEPNYSTTIAGSVTGWESRNANWESGRNRFNSAHTVQNQAQLDQLIEFFHAMKGSAYTFKYTDESDYKSRGVMDPISFTDQIIINAAVGGENNVLLTKTYTEASETHSTVRKITQPNEATVLVGVGLPGATAELTPGVDFTMVDGRIVLTTPLIAGQQLTAGYIFYSPMRFEEDRIPVRLEHYLNGSAQVPVIEVRIKIE